MTNGAPKFSVSTKDVIYILTIIGMIVTFFVRFALIEAKVGDHEQQLTDHSLDVIEHKLTEMDDKIDKQDGKLTAILDKLDDL